MSNKQIIVNNMKDFFYELEDILQGYYEKWWDSIETIKKIEELKEVAKDSGIQVNVSDTILNNITPFTSYETSYGTC